MKFQKYSNLLSLYTLEIVKNPSHLRYLEEPEEIGDLDGGDA